MRLVSQFEDHPWYGRIRVAMDGPRRDDWRPLTDEELGRLTPAKRARLAELLEQDAADRASLPPDHREPLFDMLFGAFTEAAAGAADPEAFWHALELHERAKRRHLARMRSAQPPQDLAVCRPQELLAEALSELHECERMATAGFPSPDKTMKREQEMDKSGRASADGSLSPEPARIAARTHRSGPPRKVLADVEVTEGDRDKQYAHDGTASNDQELGDRLAPYRSKASGSSWQPATFVDD